MRMFTFVVLLIISLALAACGVNGAIDETEIDGANNSLRKVYLDTTNLTLTEGGAAVISVVMDERSSESTTVSLQLIGMAGRFDPIPISVTIPPQATSQSIVLQTIDDSIYQGTQYFTFAIAGVGNDVKAAPNSLLIRLNDNDAVPTLSVDAPSVNENTGTMTFTVTQNRLSIFNSSFDWLTQDGTATTGSDYTTVGLGSAAVSAGNLTTTLTVPITGDANVEPNETLQVVLSNPSNATLMSTTATGTIVNDDGNPEVNFTLASQNVSEGTSTATFDVVLSGSSPSTITVPLNLAGTATGTDDYSVSSTSLTFNPGETSKTVTITVVNDTLDEIDETVVVTIGAPTNANIGSTISTHTLTIQDNDSAPTIAISSETVSESAGTVSVTVSLSAASGKAISFDWTTTNGTATGPADFTAASGSDVTFTAGQTSKTITVAIAADSLYESDETFNIVLSDPVNATIPSTTGVVTIDDDDSAPTISVSAASQTVNEGDTTATITVQLSAASGVDASAAFTISGTATGSGTDYSISPTASVTVTAGNTTADITVTLVDDSLSEGSETVIATLNSATNATLGATNVHTATVNDNDAPIVNFTTASQSVNESAGLRNSWPSSLAAWSFRRQIKINNTVNENLTDFPVMVKLNSSRITYASTKSAGEDLRFTDASGNILAHEIESWNSAGDSIVWVKVPSISASSVTGFIFMYYGNSAATDAQNAAQVWSNNYHAVWHFGTSLTDVTSNAVALTNNGTTVTTGTSGSARNFSNSYLALPNTYIQTKNPFTVEFAFKTSSAGGVIAGTNRNAPGGAGGGYDPFLYVDNNGYLRGGFYTGSIQQVMSPSTVHSGAWQFTSFTVSTSGWSLYLNGNSLGSIGSGSVMQSNEDYGQFGTGYTDGWPALSGGWRPYTGDMDEMRIRSVVSTPGWIQAQYLSQTDAFVQYGSQQSHSNSQVTVSVTLSANAAATATIPFTVSGTAANPTNHQLADGSITVAAGASTGNVTFDISNDLVNSSNLTVILTMGTPTNATVGTTTTHTVTIVNDTNAAPLAVTDNLTVTTWSTSTLDVLANDTDSSNDELSITSLGTATHGTVAIYGKFIQYTPTAGILPSTDSFTYTINDGRGGTATGTVNLSWAVPFTWMGSAGDGLWTNGANWTGGVAPTNGNTAYFNGQCTSCSVTINANTTIDHLMVGSTYSNSESITQGSGRTLTVNGNIEMRAGQFLGSDAAISIGANLDLRAGTFRSTSATLHFSGATVNFAPGSTFDHNSGTFRIWAWGPSTTITPNSKSFYNLLFNMTGANKPVSFSGQSANVEGLLTFDLQESYGLSSVNNGNLNVYGDVVATNNSQWGGGSLGDVKVILKGKAGGQTVTGNGTHVPYFPALVIDSGTYPVTIAGNLSVRSDWTYISSGALTTTGSTIYFSYYNSITPGPYAYNNIQMSAYQGWHRINLNGANMIINGTLTLALTENYGCPELNNGQMWAYGNVVVAGNTSCGGAGAGSAWVVLKGNPSGQTITATPGASGLLSNLEIATGTDPVTFVGTIRIYNSYKVTSVGTLTTTGTTLEFISPYTSSATIEPGNIVYNHVTFWNTTRSAYTLTGTLNVGGNLIYNVGDYYGCGTITTGTVKAYGNVTIQGNCGAGDGNASLEIAGSANTTLTHTSGRFPRGTVILNKTGGASVTQLTPVTLSGSGQALNIQNGSWLMNGLNLTVPGTLTIDATGTVTQGGGALSYGSLVNSGTLN